MRVYAAVSANQSPLHIATEGSYRRLLVSYAFDHKSLFREKMRALDLDPNGYDVLLDSGAFSVWTSGDTVDLDAYIAWAQGWRRDVPDAVVRPINLDVIPGTPGGAPPTARERSAAVRKSERNADRVRAAGLPAIEVFHWHEPLSVLDKLLERREPGMPVGIGGLAGHGSSTAKAAFVDTVFAHVKKRSGGWDGIPPLHGLGISPDAPLGRRYPWAQMDASTWMYPQRMGQPVARDGKRGKTAEDKRARNNDVAGVYMRRILRNWERLERDLTRLWESRGVRILD